MNVSSKKLALISLPIIAVAITVIFTNATVSDQRFAMRPERIDWDKSIENSRNDLNNMFERLEKTTDHRFESVYEAYDRAIERLSAKKDEGAAAVMAAKNAVKHIHKYVKDAIDTERKLAVYPLLYYSPSEEEEKKETETKTSEGRYELKDMADSSKDDDGKVSKKEEIGAVTRLPAKGYRSGNHEQAREFAYRTWRWNIHNLKTYVKDTEDLPIIMLSHAPLDQIFTLLEALKLDLRNLMAGERSHYIPPYMFDTEIKRPTFWEDYKKTADIVEFRKHVHEARVRLILSLMLSSLNKLYTKEIKSLAEIFDEDKYPYALVKGRIHSYAEDNRGVYRLYHGRDVAPVNFQIVRSSKHKNIKYYPIEALLKYRYGKLSMPVDLAVLELSYGKDRLDKINKRFQSCLEKFNDVVDKLNSSKANFDAVLAKQSKIVESLKCSAAGDAEKDLRYLDRIIYTKAIEQQARQYFAQRKVEHEMNKIKRDLKNSGKKGHADFADLTDKLDDYARIIDYIRFAADRKPFDEVAVVDFQSTYRRMAIEDVNPAKINFSAAQLKSLDEVLKKIDSHAVDRVSYCFGGHGLKKNFTANCSSMSKKILTNFNHELMSDLDNIFEALDLKKKVLKTNTIFTNAPNVYRFTQKDIQANILRWASWNVEKKKVSCHSKKDKTKNICDVGEKVVSIAIPPPGTSADVYVKGELIRKGTTGIQTCIQGKSYGIEEKTIWVSGSCNINNYQALVVKEKE